MIGPLIFKPLCGEQPIPHIQYRVSPPRRPGRRGMFVCLCCEPGMEMMKGRYCMALYFVVIALLFIPGSAHSQNSGISYGFSAQDRMTASNLQRTPEQNPEQVYVVRRGDSLIKISRIFDTTPEALRSANGLKGSKIIIGQKLRIPVSQSTAAEANAPRETADPVLPDALSVSSGISLQQNQIDDIDVDTGSRRMRLIEAGFELLNVRYRFGGGSEKYGFDCSGLVKNLFSKFNIELPHSSREQFKQGEKVDRDKLEAGDLVFFSSGGKLPTHVGIYIGNDRFLHAARRARKVIISDLNKFWYTMRYLGARRIMDLWWEEPDSPEENN
jgi:cell wall-associated NlpC family hydrolase